MPIMFSGHAAEHRCRVFYDVSDNKFHTYRSLVLYRSMQFFLFDRDSICVVYVTVCCIVFFFSDNTCSIYYFRFYLIFIHVRTCVWH